MHEYPSCKGRKVLPYSYDGAGSESHARSIPLRQIHHERHSRHFQAIWPLSYECEGYDLTSLCCKNCSKMCGVILRWIGGPQPRHFQNGIYVAPKARPFGSEHAETSL
jgi:hypothetical protein